MLGGGSCSRTRGPLSTVSLRSMYAGRLTIWRYTIHTCSGHPYLSSPPRVPNTVMLAPGVLRYYNEKTAQTTTLTIQNINILVSLCIPVPWVKALSVSHCFTRPCAAAVETLTTVRSTTCVLKPLGQEIARCCWWWFVGGVFVALYQL